MIKIAIYTKDNDGLIAYHGKQLWMDRKQVMDYYFANQEPENREVLMGWPHPSVTWHGNLGFGESA